MASLHSSSFSFTFRLKKKTILKLPQFFFALLIDAHFVSQVQIFEYSLRIWLIRIASMTRPESQRLSKTQTPYIVH